MILAELRTDPLPTIIGDEYLSTIDMISKFLDAYRFPVTLVGPPGSGKCVAASEYITLADGRRVQAGELIGTEFDVLTLVDGKSTIVHACAAFNEVETVYQLETKSGKRIVRNAQHPLWTATIDRSLYNKQKKDHGIPGVSTFHRMRVNGWTPMSEVLAGDLVAVARELPAFPEMPYPLGDAEICILAYLLGDVRFAQLSNKQLYEFRKCVEHMGCWLVEHGEYNYIVRSRGNSSKNKVIQMLREHGMMGTHSRDKSFPAAVWSFNRNQLAMFLSRLYSTDGWASVGKVYGTHAAKVEIGYCSSSRQLADDVQEALVRLGISSDITPKYNKKYGSTAWIVTVSRANDVLLFVEQIGIYGKEDAIARVTDIAHDRIELDRTCCWRETKAVEGTVWERVKSVTPVGLQPTVAIEVPGPETFLTLFYEHNSHIGTYIAASYAKRHGVRAFGLVNDLETTKSTLVAGFRMINGTMKVVKGVVAEAMTGGDIVFLDEFTHGAETNQTMLNTVVDRNSRTSVGEEIYEGQETFRLMTAHNNFRYAGNNQLVPSWASRQATWEVLYPSSLTEARIAKLILKEMLHQGEANLTVPDGVIKYLTMVMREVREMSPVIALSARNVAIAIAQLELLHIELPNAGTRTVDSYFRGDSVQRRMAERVLGKSPTDVTQSDYRNPIVLQAMSYFTSVGVEEVRKIILRAYMYHLDVKGSTLKGDAQLRARIHQLVI